MSPELFRFAGAPPRREALDGLASLEWLLDHLWSLTLVQAEVPGVFGVRPVVEYGVRRFE